jgi:hypothetical protein
MRLRCSVCGKTREVMTETEAAECVLGAEDLWYAVRYSKEDPDHEPRIRSVVCHQPKCLASVVSKSAAGIRFKDASGRVWDALPLGCQVEKTRLTEILVAEEFGSV